MVVVAGVLSPSAGGISGTKDHTILPLRSPSSSSTRLAWGKQPNPALLWLLKRGLPEDQGPPGPQSTGHRKEGFGLRQPQLSFATWLRALAACVTLGQATEPQLLSL